MKFNDKAELLNGRLAMIGFIAGVGSYFLTGHVIPGTHPLADPAGGCYSTIFGDYYASRMDLLDLLL